MSLCVPLNLTKLLHFYLLICQVKQMLIALLSESGTKLADDAIEKILDKVRAVLVQNLDNIKYKYFKVKELEN